MSYYRSSLKGARISPQKARLVLDLVRGCSVEEALDSLVLMNKKAAPMVEKLIKSAVAGIKLKEEGVDVDSLYVEEAFATDGPTLKRFLPRAQGRATPLLKRSSHITISLGVC